MTRATGVATACSQGSTGTPVSASSSAIPDRKADEPVQVTSSCTRKSSWNSGSTSRSRVAEVTLWMTNRTGELPPRVAQRAASSPTGTRIQPSRPTFRIPPIGPVTPVGPAQGRAPFM
ncbi:hypothetical protein [Streptomyces sp. NBC_00203]|uniref:hypothetical protein n=1 Tax=Streptomyces sp. NBC_00203 TaxID=2975680 RepID=UPI00324CB27F